MKLTPDQIKDVRRVALKTGGLGAQAITEAAAPIVLDWAAEQLADLGPVVVERLLALKKVVKA